MVSLETFRKLALSFPETTEEPHFEKISFRVKGKIFATYEAKGKRACAKLSMIDQGIYSLVDKKVIFPVDNKWATQGWTFVDMQKIKKKLFDEVLTASYCLVAPRILVESFAGKTLNKASHRVGRL